MKGQAPDVLQPCDSLRTIDSLYAPDERNEYFSRFDHETASFCPISAPEHIADISLFVLSTDVPLSIRIHFETAKNLYVYAWFVYRFYPVAEQQALTSLEFALRERLIEEARRSLSTKKIPEGLSGWLKEALRQGAISNDRFSWREARAWERARQRAELQQIEEMQRLGHTEIRIDTTNVVPLPEDYQVDWIGIFIRTLPTIRNQYAHGSDTLHNTVSRTFEIVSELINQLFCSA